MSDLLNSASLVMIPSGYAEDTVYSVVPSDGSGDMSFTRASNGTRVNSAGLVEVCPWNLLEYSNAFNTAPWSMNVTSGQAGKDGQNNAWLLTKLGATSSDYYLNNVYNGAQTFTIYVKKESGKGFKLYPIGTTTTNVEVNLQTGVVLNQDAAITSTTVEAYSSTWWKISVALNMINSNYYIYVTNGAGTQIASSITIQDAQVNIGLTAKPYFPTTDRLNVPRLTYQNGGGGCPSLLLEKQSTNLLSYSEQFDNSGWTKFDTTITANSTTSPDGTTNADSIIDNTTNTRHLIEQPITGDLSITRAMSLYAKQNTLRYLYMSVTNAGDSDCYSAIFDLQSGTVSATKVNGSATINASIESVGNGWYRCTITGTMTSGTATFYPLIGTSDRAGFTGTLVQNNAPSYAGSGQSLYIYGAQLEASSYPTSYIPTTSSSATRVADACSKTGISSLIGQTEGVVFYDGYLGNELSEIYAFLQQSLGNTITSSMYLQYTGGQITWLGWDSSTNQQWAIGGGGYTLGQRIKIAGAYKANDIVLYVNGTQIGTDTSATIPTCTALELGDYPALPSDNVYRISKPINQVALFKTRLSNSDLIALTTI